MPSFQYRDLIVHQFPTKWDLKSLKTQVQANSVSLWNLVLKESFLTSFSIRCSSFYKKIKSKKSFIRTKRDWLSREIAPEMFEDQENVGCTPQWTPPTTPSPDKRWSTRIPSQSEIPCRRQQYFYKDVIYYQFPNQWDLNGVRKQIQTNSITLWKMELKEPFLTSLCGVLIRLYKKCKNKNSLMKAKRDWLSREIAKENFKTKENTTT